MSLNLLSVNVSGSQRIIWPPMVQGHQTILNYLCSIKLVIKSVWLTPISLDLPVNHYLLPAERGRLNKSLARSLLYCNHCLMMEDQGLSTALTLIYVTSSHIFTVISAGCIWICETKRWWVTLMIDIQPLRNPVFQAEIYEWGVMQNIMFCRWVFC